MMKFVIALLFVVCATLVIGLPIEEQKDNEVCSCMVFNNSKALGLHGNESD